MPRTSIARPLHKSGRSFMELSLEPNRRGHSPSRRVASVSHAIVAFGAGRRRCSGRRSVKPSRVGSDGTAPGTLTAYAPAAAARASPRVSLTTSTPSATATATAAVGVFFDRFDRFAGSSSSDSSDSESELSSAAKYSSSSSKPLASESSSSSSSSPSSSAVALRFAAALACALACLAEPVATPGCAKRSLSNQSPLPATAAAFEASLAPRSTRSGFGFALSAASLASFATARSLARTAAASSSTS
mmetsp:Transcript_13173/g.51509  ORF Transcript_13173/g.51509 Transcript_13173/m.51509 type:complete len:246 (+) Transcript_13173:4231-4968(+)